MPTQTSFSLVKTDDGAFLFGIQPPINISGLPIEFNLMSRFNATPLVTLYCASGFNNVSGLNVTNGPQGVLTVNYFHQYVSGRDYQNYAFTIVRTSSGHQTTMAEGFLISTP